MTTEINMSFNEYFRKIASLKCGNYFVLAILLPTILTGLSWKDDEANGDVIWVMDTIICINVLFSGHQLSTFSEINREIYVCMYRRHLCTCRQFACRLHSTHSSLWDILCVISMAIIIVFLDKGKDNPWLWNNMTHVCK